MKKEIFDELIASVKEAGAILRGEKKASRVTTITRTPDHRRSPDLKKR